MYAAQQMRNATSLLGGKNLKGETDAGVGPQSRKCSQEASGLRWGLSNNSKHLCPVSQTRNKTHTLVKQKNCFMLQNVGGRKKITIFAFNQRQKTSAKKKLTPRSFNFTQMKLKIGDLTQGAGKLSLMNHSDTSYLQRSSML